MFSLQLDLEMQALHKKEATGGEDNMIKSGAILSEDQKYRYKLWRVWDSSLPYVLWILLNPSTADHTKDDPTIRRCIRFTESWGYGGLYVGNLFAYRATNPRELRDIPDAYGPDNFYHMWEMIKMCPLIVCGWGSYPQANGDLYQLALINKRIRCLGRNKDGSPKHPLYVPAKTPLQEFKL